jgi:tripartite-type tricarboxylate transporter receptor subunit TctC
MIEHRTTPLSRFRRWTAAFLAGASAMAASPAALANAAEFYNGKTITFVIAAPPGGGYDLSARLLVRHLGQHVPGQPAIVPQNMPGAGGFRVANYLASAAPRDGLAIGMHTRGIIQAPMLGDPAARFDAADFSWLGTVSSSQGDAYLLVVNRKSGVKSIADMRRSGPAVTLGSVGGITTNVVFALLSPQVFGFNSRLISGYDGSASVMLALVRGEIDGAYVGLSSLTGAYGEPLARGDIMPVMQLARTTPHPRFPNIPMSQDRVESPDNKALLAFAESIFKVALPVSGPPGVPPDRLDALRAGFNAATSSKSYLEEAEKFGVDASALDGVEVKRIIEEMKRTPPGVIQRYKDILASAK